MNRPQIKTELPGPKAKEIIQRDAKVMSTSLSRDVPLVVERTQDVWIYDVDGNEFLDMTSGVGVTNVGHTNPQVVEAIKNQVEKFLHFAGTDFYYEPQVTLAESLNDIRPFEEPGRVFFTNSGTESVEACIKLARYKTRRPLYIGFLGGFHGRTMGSLSFTSSKVIQRRYFSPMMPQVVHIPFPDTYRPPEGVVPEKVTDFVIWYLNRMFEILHLWQRLFPLRLKIVTVIQSMKVTKHVNFFFGLHLHTGNHQKAFSLSQVCYGLHVSGTVVIGNGNYVQTFQNAHVHNVIRGHIIRTAG